MSYTTPQLKFAATYVDASGYTKPAVGYKLYSYAAGTSTPKDTYTSSTLGTANTNPVVLDARGEADIWLSGNYKFSLKTDADVLVWTVDNIADLTTSGTFTNATISGTLTVTSTAVTWSGNPTHSGNHTWTGNQVFNGNVTIGDAGADSLTVNPNAVAWAGNPTHSGNHTFTGSLTCSTGLITSGTYSPTFTSVTNLDGTPTILGLWRYTRVGKIVSGFGAVTYNPTAAGQVNFRISLPIASNFAAITDLAGSMSCSQTPEEESMRVIADIATDTMSAFLVSAATVDTVANIMFSYEVI